MIISAIANVLLEAVRQGASILYCPINEVPVYISALVGADVLLFALLAYLVKLAVPFLTLFDAKVEIGLLSLLLEFIRVGRVLNYFKLRLFLFTSIKNSLLI